MFTFVVKGCTSGEITWLSTCPGHTLVTLPLCILLFVFKSHLGARCFTPDWSNHFSGVRELHGQILKKRKEEKLSFYGIFSNWSLFLSDYCIPCKFSLVWTTFLLETFYKTKCFNWISLFSSPCCHPHSFVALTIFHVCFPCLGGHSWALAPRSRGLLFVLCCLVLDRE